MHCAENAPFFFTIVLQQFASLCFDKADSLSVSYNITFEWFTMSLSISLILNIRGTIFSYLDQGLLKKWTEHCLKLHTYLKLRISGVGVGAPITPQVI